MSQHDFVVANDTGANVRADLNAGLQALASLSSGTSEPGTTYAGMFWLDTTNHILKRRNEANNAWIAVAKFDETNGLGAPYAWNAALDEAFEDLASASTTNLATPVSRNVRITGTTTITAFGTVKAGSVRHLRFADALTLTHNGTSLILPGGANITTAANDTATFVSLGSGNWLCLNYKRQSGVAVVVASQKRIQRQITSKTDTSTIAITAGTFADVTGMSVSITATSGNKIVIKGAVTLGVQTGPEVAYLILLRDSTVISPVGASPSNRKAASWALEVGANTRMATLTFEFEDTAPDGSAHTYKLQMTATSSKNWHVNRSESDTDNSGFARMGSWIAAEEWPA